MSDWSTTSTGPRAPLTRSDEPTIAGVAGGVSEFTGIKPIIVRALFVVLGLAGGAGCVAYIGLWLLIPGRNSEANESRPPQAVAAGGALLLLSLMVGIMALAGVGQPINIFLFGVLFAGIATLNRRPDGWATGSAAAGSTSMFDAPFSSEFPGPLATPDLDPIFNTSSFPQPEAPTVPIPDTAFDETESWPPPAESSVSAPDPASTSDPASAPDPASTPDPAPAPQPPPAPSPSSGTGTERPVAPGAIPTMEQIQRSHWAVAKMADETVDRVVQPPVPAGPPLGLIAMSAIAAVLGTALVLNTMADIFVGSTTVVGSSMAVVGLLFTIGAFKGRVLPLVPLAVVLLVLLPASPIIDHALTDGIGSSSVSVDAIDDLSPSYQVGIGDLSIDLSDLELTEDTVIEAEVGTGSLHITVPRGIPVLARGQASVGVVSILGEGRGGLGNDLRVRPPSSFDEDTPRLIIDASVDIGGIDIHRAWRASDFADAPDADRPELFDDFADLPEPFDDFVDPAEPEVFDE